MAITGEIAPSVLLHLRLAYMTVFVGLAAAVAGASVHVMWYPGGWLTCYGIVGGFGFIMAAPRRKEVEKMHILFLVAVSLWEGFCVGPGIRMSLCCYPMSILVTILMGAALTFGCFLGATLVSKRGEFIFLGGLMSSAFSFLLWLRYASDLFGLTAFNFRLGVYVRVLVFLGYFIFDTKQMMERAQHGDMDIVKHALTLSSDFLAVLVPLIVILAKIAFRLKDTSPCDVPAEDPFAANPKEMDQGVLPPANLNERVRERRDTDLDLRVHALMLLVCGVSFLLQ